MRGELPESKPSAILLLILIAYAMLTCKISFSYMNNADVV